MNDFSGEYLFRSNNFQQIVAVEDAENRALVLFRDLATEQTFRCHSGILKEIATLSQDLKTQREHISCFHTEWRARNLQEYQYIINSLTAACQACIKTGNPIRWR